MSDREISEKSTPKTATEPNALQEEASSALNSRLAFVQERAILLDTRTGDPAGTRVGPTDGDKEITSTIMVRSKSSEKELNDTLRKVVNHEIKPLTNEEFNARFGADPQAMQRVSQFAKDNGLTITDSDPVSGRVELKGAVKKFSEAFRVQIDDYVNANGEMSRERSGAITVPRNIAQDVQGVFGLDSRDFAHPHFVLQPKDPIFSPRITSGFMPNQVADAYNFPKESMGAGQSVGIIELGGGLDLNDNALYYQKNGLKAPTIQLVGVDGAANTVGGSADSEVALDSQVIGAVAPDANQQLVFGPPTEQGFLDTITRATFPKEGELQNSAISISWGGRESSWSEQAVHNMDLAFKKAAVKGISIFAASGDAGAGDLNPGQKDDHKFVADFPAADPWVTAAGGTKLTVDGAGKPDDVVWNEGKTSSTGGGISQIFPVPDFQKDVKLPDDANYPRGRAGRGVPDVAGNADPFTGYRIRVGGQDGVIGGTSAVAPLYAALTMRLNGALGHPVGYLNPFIYANNSKVFRDITAGNNNGYNAGPGWDATTGWGVVKGDEILKELRKVKEPGK